jgi:hypothetical protein
MISRFQRTHANYYSRFVGLIWTGFSKQMFIQRIENVITKKFFACKNANEALHLT